MTKKPPSFIPRGDSPPLFEDAAQKTWKALLAERAVVFAYYGVQPSAIALLTAERRRTLNRWHEETVRSSGASPADVQAIMDAAARGFWWSVTRWKFAHEMLPNGHVSQKLRDYFQLEHFVRAIAEDKAEQLAEQWENELAEEAAGKQVGR